jgi:hypothetical protein
VRKNSKASCPFSYLGVLDYRVPDGHIDPTTFKPHRRASPTESRLCERCNFIHAGGITERDCFRTLPHSDVWRGNVVVVVIIIQRFVYSSLTTFLEPETSLNHDSGLLL